MGRANFGELGSTELAEVSRAEGGKREEKGWVTPAASCQCVSIRALVGGGGLDGFAFREVVAGVDDHALAGPQSREDFDVGAEVTP
jgi:hypothetical protein